LKRVIIFGAGYHGRAIFRKLKNDPNNFQILCFVDNDHNKHSSEFARIPIYSPNDLQGIDFDQVLLAGREIPSQLDQLKKLKIPNSKIKVYKKSEIVASKDEIINRENATIKMINIVLNIFNKNKIDYWLDYSSLLALYRGDNFSEYSDVDITVVSYKATDILWKSLVSLNAPNVKFHKINEKREDFKKIKKIGMNSEVDIEQEEPAGIDILVSALKNDVYVSDINGKPCFTPASYFSGFDLRYYNQLELRVPLNLNDYLEFIYGKDWKIPAEQWNATSYKNLI
jgi:hypothetical protein